jgi:hypothetical protein
MKWLSGNNYELEAPQETECIENTRIKNGDVMLWNFL